VTKSRNRSAPAPTPGVLILALVVLGTALLWFLARPAQQPIGRYIGEFLGVEAVLLFSCTRVSRERLRCLTFGGFDYRKGGQQQVWIAGGMGITPFMSWLRSLRASQNSASPRAECDGSSST
jgi:hypothetical protein